MSTYDYRYDDILAKLDNLQNVSNDIKNQILAIDIENITLESNIDIYDLVFGSIFGIIGATISTNKAIEKFTNDIHDIASSKNVKGTNKLQNLLGVLLKHNGDDIDSILIEGNRKIVDRDGNPVVFMHRLLRGHDPLSVKGDNPIKVLCSQHGITRGLTQVVKHLIGDTFSKEGLPIPGHSFFDFKGEDGKLSNYFLTVSKNLAKQSSKTDTRSVYEGMFTINTQEIASQGLVFALCKAYIAFRGIKDDTRERQLKIITYGFNFFTHACIGVIRQGGIPYIHWPALVALTKEFAGLYIHSYKEVRQLEKKTNELVQYNVDL
ncbi:MAG: hypothetical protein GYA02_15220, partial [Clostridiaceae bacterium]|nr:hypothetical protein [Clostridiaceae bacterium]